MYQQGFILLLNECYNLLEAVDCIIYIKTYSLTLLHVIAHVTKSRNLTHLILKHHDF